ncbi:molybdate ABC transporter ATP-binding protein ModF [Alteromonas lipolytica]|uniref:Molybdenum ABC transporter ATP-binding protein n=1 Tax=Alteromonas lipolytica TaxID=1856405 RepID=A0A1E8F9Q4_9ALTE|nr:molybdate ABC transporter ATP-binding protein ModF [Alteromonas lipolytica]OFI32642.1 molybdenum ABC transporter ATP-binding protein [Alteromonas lipolytica]GGF74458.1 molybdate ABC transporter ATP-binding protein ModF [Alteromonas lipolytica]
MSIVLNQLTVKLNDQLVAECPPLTIEPGQHTIISGLNGSGKSVLAAVLAGDGKVLAGQREISGRTGWVSVTQQQRIIEAERRKDDADILDVVPVPSSAREVILRGLPQPDKSQQALAELADLLGIAELLDREFLALSTGETRKVILTRELLLQPDWLVLDEPYDGLDVETVARFSAYLQTLAGRCTVIMVVNRVSEIPVWAGRLLFMQNYRVAWQVEAQPLNDEALTPLNQILHIQHNVKALPGRDSDCHAPLRSDPDAPLVNLIDGRVAWGDNVVFEHLNWTIRPGEHWQVTGPNGSGKTCLLTLITGDNPLCYSNNLNVFGYQRGSGESIWDIKQHLGIVSNSLHLQYRVNCSVADVVCSGFYDSIGLYKTPTDRQRMLCGEWLSAVGLDHEAKTPFQSLSFGDQRLLLIVRAMVKHPSLLILDEPCNGLDEVNRTKVLAMLELLAREGGTTLLYVNHHSEDKIPSIHRCLNMSDYR